MFKRVVLSVCTSLAIFGGVAQAQTLNGAGASFPKPLYDRLIGEYHRIQPEVKINYVSVGSGAGIRQFSEGTIDFGGTDSPMTDAQMAAAVGGRAHHIPTAIGAVVPIYNIEGVSDLRFTGPVLADIFQGNITHWNDPKLTAINPGITLPAAPITVVQRSDASGTTAIFTDYLSKVSPEFLEKIGRGTSVKWTAPNLVGAKGNEQMAANVMRVRNSIGYVELIFAMANNIRFAPVQNRAGNFVAASLEATSAAAAGIRNAPADLRMSITDAEGANSYPIAGMTWILVYNQQNDAAKGKALVDFLWWVIHDGQAISSSLHYAPLPTEVASRAREMLLSITGPDGRPLRTR